MLCYAPDVKLSQSDLDLNETREVLVLIQERQFSFNQAINEQRKFGKGKLCFKYVSSKAYAPVGHLPAHLPSLCTEPPHLGPGSVRIKSKCLHDLIEILPE